MRAIRVLKQLMQNLENSQLKSNENKDLFADVVSFNNLPPTDSLGLSSRIINVLKSDLLVLSRIKKKLELGEENPFQAQFYGNDQEGSHNQEGQVSQQDNELIEKLNLWYNEKNKIKISQVIELIKMCIRKVEKGEDIEIQQLIAAYDPEYGLLYCHLFCLVIEQVLTFTKLIQIEEIMAKCLNRMIEGINFQNMQYLETIISDNLKKIEQVIQIINQYLPEQHSIVVIYEKYNTLLQKLQVQNSILYSNNQIIPNFNDLQSIIQKIQDYLYSPSPQKQNQDQQFFVALIVEEIIKIFNNSFQRLQNIQLDHKSKHILYDRIEKILITCQMSPQYIQYQQQQKDQTKPITPKYSLLYNLNESSFYSQSSKTMSNMSYYKKKSSTVYQDYKILLNLLKKIGEYLISKNENIIALKDNNHQIVYICKHNQIDFSNPVEKLLNSQFNQIQDSETDEKTNKYNNKNYSEIYKQIVLNSKYFNHIVRNKKIYQEQLQNIIYKGNQYEKEGSQVLQGLKSQLIIEIDVNVESILIQNNSTLLLILTDILNGEQICETSLEANINKIPVELPFSISPCNIQIIEYQQKPQSQQENYINQNLEVTVDEQQYNDSQSYILFEKDTYITQFINTYIKLAQINLNQINLKEIDFNLNYDQSISPSLSSIDVSQTPEMDLNQAPVFAIFQHALQSYSISPQRSKRVSQDTFYKGSLKSIEEEENQSSISANNLEIFKDKKRQKIENLQQKKQLNPIISPEINDPYGKSVGNSPPASYQNKEEQLTKFRFFIENKQLQFRENNFKNKNVGNNNTLNQSLEIEEVNLFNEKPKNNPIKNIEKQKQKQNQNLKKLSTLSGSMQDNSKQNHVYVLETQINSSLQQTRSNLGSYDSLNDRQEEENQIQSKQKKQKQINFVKPYQNNSVHPQQQYQNTNTKKQAGEKQQQNKLQKQNQLQPLSLSNTQKLSLSNQSNQFSIDNSLISLPNSKRNSQLQKNDLLQNTSINTSVVSIQYSQNESLQPYQQNSGIGKGSILDSNSTRSKSNYYYSLEQSKENITILQQKNYNLIHNNNNNNKLNKTSALNNNNQNNNLYSVVQNKEKRSQSVQPNQLNPLNKLNNRNQVNLKPSLNQVKMRNQKLKLEDESNLDFDVNTQIKSFYGVLREIKTTKINIDM